MSALQFTHARPEVYTHVEGFVEKESYRDVECIRPAKNIWHHVAWYLRSDAGRGYKKLYVRHWFLCHYSMHCQRILFNTALFFVKSLDGMYIPLYQYSDEARVHLPRTNIFHSAKICDRFQGFVQAVQTQKLESRHPGRQKAYPGCENPLWYYSLCCNPLLEVGSGCERIATYQDGNWSCTSQKFTL